MLAVAIKEYFPSAKPTLILGILQDKDWAGICRILTPLAGRILVVPVASERSATPQKLGEACRRANPAALVVERPSLSAALGQITGEEFVVITGSLYLIGEALERLEITPAMATSERELNEWVTHL